MNNNNLTNIELMLLQIVSQQKSISGYQINRLIAERGYRDWVDVGSTPIYVGLTKLASKKLVESFLDTHKQGKGPPPKMFSITPSGKERLKAEMVDALSSAQVNDSRFDLGIAGIPFLDRDEIVVALGNRKRALTDYAAQIESRYRESGGDNLKLHIRVLFEHSLNAIKNEISFADRLIGEIRESR
ncbi:MAG: PadR family transcriptional regulator [candidate division Zixibacteria bacterium]|nr:PadR family transcriptional regulator [candidate division Zixibacteria bacterium]MBU1471189.1 PadR family transcriptional regulator [candidate division Zixibacteria bacterium]MBU2625770.1 PadR family transcriptional regulator [candidate division Zixibacteria bacterium]